MPLHSPSAVGTVCRRQRLAVIAICFLNFVKRRMLAESFVVFHCLQSQGHICKLLAVKHGDLELNLFSNSVLGAFIEFLCTNLFLLSAYFVYFRAVFNNKINKNSGDCCC